MRIFASHDGTGCGYYRVVLPMEQFQKNGHEVTVVDQKDATTKSYLQGEWDLIVGQRFASFEGLATWRRARKPKNRLVYENDDDVFSIGMDNFQAYHTYRGAVTRDAVQSYAQIADLVTVTNSQLAEVFSEHAGRTAVLPNFIPEFVLELPRTDRKRPVVGWVGGASHGLDMHVICEPLRRFARRNSGWDLYLGGTDYRPTLKIPGDRVEFRRWVAAIDDREGFYQSLDFDIGICPLLDNSFNHSKSFIKALEYNARGIPVVASSVGPYKEYVTHGYNGFLVKGDHEWVKYLELLANDDELRAKMGQNARDRAAEHTIEENWTMWEAAYKQLWKNR
jgi:glycosyltransferase involved in cell wall biosynthesis